MRAANWVAVGVVAAMCLPGEAVGQQIEFPKIVASTATVVYVKDQQGNVTGVVHLYQAKVEYSGVTNTGAKPTRIVFTAQKPQRDGGGRIMNGPDGTPIYNTVAGREYTAMTTPSLAQVPSGSTLSCSQGYPGARRNVVPIDGRVKATVEYADGTILSTPWVVPEIVPTAP